MDAFERVQEFGECEYGGPPIFKDLDGKHFFESVRVHNKVVSIGDLVCVVLEGDDDQDEESVSFGYCQVLAIYDEPDTLNGEGVQFEARWFITIDELDAKQQKLIPEEGRRPDELIETNVLDDVPIGSVSDHIQIVQYSPPEESEGADHMEVVAIGDHAKQQIFHCRYLQQQGTQALQYVQRNSLFTRGAALSHYEYAYVEYIASLPATDDRVSGSSNLSTSNADSYSQAIRKLHVSVLPTKLPCRSLERNYIYGVLKDAVINRRDASKPLYISGMPGTGKTATVIATINELRSESLKGDLPEFHFVEINCLRLQAPASAYSVLWRGLTGMQASSKKAQKLLEEHFENASANAHAVTNRKVTICLVDELDYLMTRNEEVVYNFFNWPLLPQSLLVVIGIANIMDLPERMTQRVASRVDMTMDRMIFKAYEHEQIKEILTERLSELQLSVFTKTSLELVSRKAATVAGDLRAALKICQRTIELHRDQEEKLERMKAEYEAAKATLSQKQAEALNTQSPEKYAQTLKTLETSLPPSPPVADNLMKLVKIAADEYKQSPMMATVTRLCAVDKAILVALCNHLRNSNDETQIDAETLWTRTSDLLRKAGTKEGVPRQPPPYIFNEALERLVEQGLLIQLGSSSRDGSSQQAGPFSLRLEFTDVVAALKGSPLLDFI